KTAADKAREAERKARDEADKAKVEEQRTRQLAEEQKAKAEQALKEAQAQRQQAEQARQQSRRALYAASMARAQRAADDKDFERVRELLEARKGADLRGFEWHYLQRFIQNQGKLPGLQGHSGSVNKIAFTKDGTKLASASNDETVRIWDATT